MNRKGYFLLALACVGSIAVLPTRAVVSQTPPEIDRSCGEIADTDRAVFQKARAIAVRVFPARSDDYKASATLIDKREGLSGGKPLNFYLVLTNDHVLQGLKKRVGNSKDGYRLQTPDGTIHHAFLYPVPIDWKNNDLGLLWFASRQEYSIAEIGNLEELQDKDPVFVAGFPLQDANRCPEGFRFTRGELFVELVKTKKWLDSGYQLGFSNDTRNGMSGGPVLTASGKIIGINGRGKRQGLGLRSGDPSIPDVDAYAFIDGTKAPPEALERFRELAWALPISTYEKHRPKEPFQVLNAPPATVIDPPRPIAPPSPLRTVLPPVTSGPDYLSLAPFVGVILFVGGTAVYLGKSKSGESQTEPSKADLPQYEPRTPDIVRPASDDRILAKKLVVSIDFTTQIVEFYSDRDPWLQLQKYPPIVRDDRLHRFDLIQTFDFPSMNFVERGDMKTFYFRESSENNQRMLDLSISNYFPNCKRFRPCATNIMKDFCLIYSEDSDRINTDIWELELEEISEKNFCPIIIDFVRYEL